MVLLVPVQYAKGKEIVLQCVHVPIPCCKEWGSLHLQSRLVSYPRLRRYMVEGPLVNVPIQQDMGALGHKHSIHRRDPTLLPNNNPLKSR